MPRTTAGDRYPHASASARAHDHRFCEVVGRIAARVAAGAEPWGTPHDMPALDAEQVAHATRNKLFNARNCGQLHAQFGELSVSVMYRKADGKLTNTRTRGAQGYTLCVRVFDRDTGRRAIIGRVRAGQPLSYNPLKGI